MSMSIDIRLRNRAEVIAAVVRENGVSRKRISALTGLSQPTVSRVIDQLIDEDLVYESGEVLEDRRGRRSVLVNLDANQNFALGIDLGAVNTRFVCIDSVGSVRAVKELQTPRELNSKNLALWIHDVSKSILGDISYKAQFVSIGLPGAVNPKTLAVSNAFNLQQIEKPEFVEQLSLLFSSKLKFDNDANFAVLGEYKYGAATGSSAAAAITLGLGLGVGLIKSGNIIHGSRGLVGEFGQLPFGTDCAPVERSITWANIQKELNSIDSKPVTPDLFFGTKSPNKFSEVRTHFSNALFLVSAAIVASTEPEVLVIGGGIAPFLGNEIPSLQELINDSFGYSPKIVISELGQYSGAIGAAIDALQRYFESLGISENTASELPAKKSFTPLQVPQVVCF